MTEWDCCKDCGRNWASCVCDVKAKPAGSSSLLGRTQGEEQTEEKAFCLPVSHSANAENQPPEWDEPATFTTPITEDRCGARWWYRVALPDANPPLSAEVYSERGQFVADCGSHETATANARLIATAPELLLMLKRITRTYPCADGSECDCGTSEILRLIAKAEVRR